MPELPLDLLAGLCCRISCSSNSSCPSIMSKGDSVYTSTIVKGTPQHADMKGTMYAIMVWNVQYVVDRAHHSDDRERSQPQCKHLACTNGFQSDVPTVQPH